MYIAITTFWPQSNTGSLKTGLVTGYNIDEVKNFIKTKISKGIVPIRVDEKVKPSFYKTIETFNDRTNSSIVDVKILATTSSNDADGTTKPPPEYNTPNLSIATAFCLHDDSNHRNHNCWRK